MGEKSNSARSGRFSSLVNAFKVVSGVSGVIVLLIAILTIFYTVLNPQGAIAIIEKLADIKQTPFPTYTPQPTILLTEIQEVTREVTREVTHEVTSEVTVVVTPPPPTYSECGEVLYELEHLTEKDIYGQARPTKLRKENVGWGPTTLAEVAACFVSDEGKKSDPSEIEEGYENKVVFYDVYGQPHIYRLILGGRARELSASRDAMIWVTTGGAFGGKAGAKTYDEFERAAQDVFKNSRNRQVVFELYVTDNAEGNISDFYMKIYQYSEIYAQIVEAIKTGEGFPEEVPDGFFIWAVTVRM